MDPDPAPDTAPDPVFFINDLRDAKRKFCLFCFLLNAFRMYIFKSFFTEKSHKKSQNSRNQGFFLLFLLDDGRIRIHK